MRKRVRLILIASLAPPLTAALLTAVILFVLWISAALHGEPVRFDWWLVIVRGALITVALYAAWAFWLVRVWPFVSDNTAQGEHPKKTELGTAGHSKDFSYHYPKITACKLIPTRGK